MPHCSYLNVWFSGDILYAFMKLCLYPGLSSTREPSGSRKLPMTGQSLWRVSTVNLAQPEMTASGKNHTEGSLSRLKIKIWISWGSLAILQELKTLADFQSNRLKTTAWSFACAGSSQWHQWEQDPTTTKSVCETLLVLCIVSVPLIFQTHTTELDCKTDRN